METNKRILPAIPTRGITIFPNMVLHFDVGRKKSILALEAAMIADQEIFLVAQKEAIQEAPELDDIYTVGTICYIKQIVKLSDDHIKVLVEGKKRAKINEYTSEEPFYTVDVEVIEDAHGDKVEEEALLRALKDSFEKYMELSTNVKTENLSLLEEVTEAGEFADMVASVITMDDKQKQEVLEASDVNERLTLLLSILDGELEILSIQKKIGAQVKEKIDKSQKEYYLREQMRAIQEELGEDDEAKREIAEYEDKIAKAKLSKEAKEKVEYELNRLKATSYTSSESAVIRTYLDWILDLPWKFMTKENIDVKEVKKSLAEEHYGLEDIKDRIAEYAAIRKMSKNYTAPILCLVGPPGVGKTSIASSIAKALNRNFVRISLGGVRDEAEIRGHRKTYVGAIPGRIIYGMKQAKSRNPLFLLDEIDKMSSNFRGNPADALLEVLDAKQNKEFRDHYLELEYDLSKVMFITTANSLETIPQPLLDRMEVIEVSGYTDMEKVNIAKKHLMPKIIKEYGIEADSIKISDSAIKKVVENYTRESGVRTLDRTLAKVLRKAIAEMVEKDRESINITQKHIVKYLGAEKVTHSVVDTEDKKGVVTGLAWTRYGGDTLPVEVTIMDGKGALQLTGKLGEVMQESAKAAYSLVRANMHKYGITEEFYKTKDVHIHVPEGAVPKDGPSAGITMTTALVSALSGKKVRSDVAMTGEITLTGRVLPIGGLKEKALAAHRAGIKTIVIPIDNKKDIDKIPDTVKNKLNIVPATQIDEVLKTALVEE